MSIIDKECDYLSFVFSVSPTKGISIFEVLLLPQEDEGRNEDLINYFTNLKNEGKIEQNVFEKIVDSLQKIRKAILNNVKERKILEQRVEMIRQVIATDLIVAEDKLGLGNMKFD